MKALIAFNGRMRLGVNALKVELTPEEEREFYDDPEVQEADETTKASWKRDRLLDKFRNEVYPAWLVEIESKLAAIGIVYDRFTINEELFVNENGDMLDFEQSVQD